jgi:integrase
LGAIQHESTRVMIALAGYAGLSRSEIQGLTWEAYDSDNGEIAVLSSVVNGKRGNPKTEARKNTVPLIPSVRELLNLYRLRLGNPLAGVIFPTANGTPLDLHNVFCDRIDPVLNACEECEKPKAAHGADSDHKYSRRSDMPEWQGWHGFRRGLASNLYDLGVDDLTIQRILRHSDVETTRKSYIKVREPNVVIGMDRLEAAIRRTETVQ